MTLVVGGTVKINRNFWWDSKPQNINICGFYLFRLKTLKTIKMFSQKDFAKMKILLYCLFWFIIFFCMLPNFNISIHYELVRSLFLLLYISE